MRLKKLVLNNFRSFLGENEIVFSTDEDKNVTLIHGENGTGKTTLLNSILWCLFGNFTENFKMQDDLLSHDAKSQGDDSYSVEVFFEWDGAEYRVKRTGGEGCNFVVNRIDEGMQIPHPSPKALINSILPKDMAGYFFFAGEGISQISKGKHRPKFRKAIRDILGFTFAEAAVNDLSHVSNQFSKAITELTRGQDNLNRASFQKAQLEKEIAEFSDALERHEEEYKEEISEQEVNENKILKYNSYNASELQAREVKLKNDLKSANEKARLIAREKRKLVQRYGWSVFGNEISSKVLNYIDDNTLKATIPAPYDETFVRKILQQKECICGREIVPGSSCEEAVKSLIVNASSGELQQRIQKARAVSEKVRGVCQEFIEEANANDELRKANDAQISSLEKEIATVQDELDNVPVDEIKKLRQEKKEIEKRKSGISQKIGAIKISLKDLRSRLSDCAKIVESEGGANTKIKKLLDSQSTIKEMIRRCKEKLAAREGEARNAIESEINYILEAFSRKDYRVELDDTFGLSLLLHDGNETGYSDGEELLLNLSFVCALISHAKLRQSNSDEFLVGGTVAPFVVDAPFGDLDNAYKATTAAYLPQATPQLVLFLSSSHWQGAVDEAISGRVGKEYVLVSNRKVPRGARPQDEIVLSGKSYMQSVYEQEADCTKIVEVR